MTIKKHISTIEQYDKSDWVYRGKNVDTPKLTFETSGKIQYNQNKVHRNSCFIHGPVGTISDITANRFGTDALIDMTNYAWTTDEADPSYGGRFRLGIQLAIKRYNTYMAKDGTSLYYYRIPMNDIDKFLNKGYSVVVGYYIGRNYTEDKFDDGVINNSKGIHKVLSKAGHCVRIMRTKAQLGTTKVTVIDNYYGKTKYNIYEIKDIHKQINQGRYFINGYVIMLEGNGILDGYKGLSLKDKILKLKHRAIVKVNKLLNNR